VIKYNPKDWFTFIFRFHKGDTFRKLLPMIVAIGFYSAFISWIEIDFLRMSENSRLKNLSIMHTMLTFVISMLLVFRTNTAYERWWEGRKLWGGLVNSSRNLSMKLHSILKISGSSEIGFFCAYIPNFAVALKNHLRGTFDTGEFVENKFFSSSNIRHNVHVPNQIAKSIFDKVHELYQSGVISGEQLLYLNGELTSFTDICGACERIKSTPIPFSYSVFLKKFIFFFVISLPLTLVFSLGYFCIPVVVFIFYVLTSIELIAEEIEDPFGVDSNDLPTDSIANNIRKSVTEILGG
jgi:putative membrane protein